MKFNQPVSHSQKQHLRTEVQSYAVLGALTDPRSSQLDVTRRLRCGTLPATASKPLPSMMPQSGTCTSSTTCLLLAPGTKPSNTGISGRPTPYIHRPCQTEFMAWMSAHHCLWWVWPTGASRSSTSATLVLLSRSWSRLSSSRPDA